MRLVNFVFATALYVLCPVAQTAGQISAEEMLRICDALSEHATHAVESNQSNVPLEIAIEKTDASFIQKPPGIPESAMAKYRAAVRTLYERVYALPDVNLRSAHQEVVPACVAQAQDQYTESDVHQMKRCDAKVWPYLGFANLRDMGVSRDQQLEWLKQEGLKSAPASPEERKRIYVALADMIDYVYARPDLSKRRIYEERFDSCMEAAG